MAHSVDAPKAMTVAALLEKINAALIEGKIRLETEVMATTGPMGFFENGIDFLVTDVEIGHDLVGFNLSTGE